MNILGGMTGDDSQDRFGNRGRAGAAGYAGCLTVAVLLVIAGLLGVRTLLVPSSFGATGHYRKAAVKEHQSLPSRHTGSDSCRECHQEEYRFWSYGEHASVACEACHGAANEHIIKNIEPRPELQLGGNEQCMVCHCRVEGRREELIPMIESFEHHLRSVEKKHVIHVDKAKIRKECVYCHDPHLAQ